MKNLNVRYTSIYVHTAYSFVCLYFKNNYLEILPLINDGERDSVGGEIFTLLNKSLACAVDYTEGPLPNFQSNSSVVNNFSFFAEQEIQVSLDRKSKFH